MIARAAWILAVSFTLAGASLADDKKSVPELQGAWKLTTVVGEAGESDFSDSPPTLIIRGEELLYGGEKIASIVADPATDPKVIDLRFPGAGGADSERVYEGIYAIDKDSLKICLNARSDGAKERPDSFSTKDHLARRLLTLRKAKDGEKEGGRGYVGLALAFNDEREEIIINDVLEGGPAKKAGLRKDDVLLELGGAAATDLRGVVDTVRKVTPGSELTVRYRRGDKEAEVKVKVGVLPFAILAGLE